MAVRSVKARLTDIAEAIDAIDGFLTTTPIDTLETNPMLHRAIERELEIISEAGRHLPEDFRNRYPDIPWRKLADIGNVLRHAYHRVDPLLLKEIVRRHLPILGAAVRDMIKDET